LFCFGHSLRGDELVQAEDLVAHQCIQQFRWQRFQHTLPDAFPGQGEVWLQLLMQQILTDLFYVG
jgi:hypothetical protein